MSRRSDTVSVERLIPSSAAKIFALLADPSRHRDIDGSGTVRETTTGGARLQLGSTFGMSMKAGVGYSMISTVIEFEEDRRIAWQTRPTNKLVAIGIGGRIWRYELEPADGGTLVRETWDISQEQIKALVWPLTAKTRIAMDTTLARIEELVA